MNRRNRGAHRNSDQPTNTTEQGDTIVTTPDLETRTDESLDETWELHRKALANADNYGAQAAAAEREQEQARQGALRLREKAAEILAQAEEADKVEQAAAKRAAALRVAEANSRAVAADHADTVNLKVQASGRQHPAERATERAARQTHPDGVLAASHGPDTTQGMPVVIDPADPLNTSPGGVGYPAAPAQNGAGS